MGKYDSWFGYGIKTGATLVVAGVEGMTGHLWNLGDLTCAGYNMMSVRVGLGLGGGTGLCAVFVYNTPNLWTLNNTKTTDWGVNMAAGGKWLEFVKLLKKGEYAKKLADIASITSKAKKMTPDQAENVRNISSYLYTNYDLLTGSGSRLVAIDIPNAGVGLELSAHYLEGRMEILS